MLDKRTSIVANVLYPNNAILKSSQQRLLLWLIFQNSQEDKMIDIMITSIAYYLSPDHSNINPIEWLWKIMNKKYEQVFIEEGLTGFFSM